MHFDIRFPIGAMFALLGVMLVGYAVAGEPVSSHGIDPRMLDGVWGAVMLLFGGGLLLLARRHRRSRRP